MFLYVLNTSQLLNVSVPIAVGFLLLLLSSFNRVAAELYSLGYIALSAGILFLTFIFSEVLIFLVFFGHTSNIRLVNALVVCSAGYLIFGDTSELARYNTMLLATVGNLVGYVIVALFRNTAIFSFFTSTVTRIGFMLLTFTEFILAGIFIYEFVLASNILGTIGLHLSHVGVIVIIRVVIALGIIYVDVSSIIRHLVEVLWLSILRILYGEIIMA